LKTIVNRLCNSRAGITPVDLHRLLTYDWAAGLARSLASQDYILNLHYSHSDFWQKGQQDEIANSTVHYNGRER